MSIKVRKIISTNCRCKLCRHEIPKGENALVFDARINGDYVQIHLHLTCVDKMHSELTSWRILGENTIN